MACLHGVDDNFFAGFVQYDPDLKEMSSGVPANFHVAAFKRPRESRCEQRMEYVGIANAVLVSARKDPHLRNVRTGAGDGQTLFHREGVAA